MTKKISFGGQVHSFPDDATEDEINQALGGAPREPSVGQDIENLPENAVNFAKTIPSELNAAYGMPLGRSLKNVAAGYLGVLNIPHELSQYAASRHIPYAEELIKHQPFKADLDPTKYLGLGERQPGDLVYQSVGPGGWAKDITAALGRGVARGASHIPQIAERAADVAPVFKFMERTPYRQREAYSQEHGIGNGIEIDPAHLAEAEDIMRSPGIRIGGQRIPELAIENAMAGAHAGEHAPIASVQSSLRTLGRDLMGRGGIYADFGRHVHGLAENIHAGMRRHYEDIGHPEVSEFMRREMQRSRRYHQLSPFKHLAAKIGLGATIAPKWVKDLVQHSIGG